AEELAAQLAAAGMTSGDTLALQLRNSVDFVAAFLAATILDLVFAPIDRDAPEVEVATILSHFGIRGLVYHSDAKATAISTRELTRRPTLPPGARLIKLTSGST